MIPIRFSEKTNRRFLGFTFFELKRMRKGDETVLQINKQGKRDGCGCEVCKIADSYIARLYKVPINSPAEFFETIRMKIKIKRLLKQKNNETRSGLKK
jgi:hypothetical protein